MPVELTAKRIKAEKPAPSGKRAIIWDAVVPGLGLRITDKGAKSFVFMRRKPGQVQPTRWTLAPWIEKAEGPREFGSLAWARTEGRRKLSLIAEGKDPDAVDAAERAAEEAAKEAAEAEERAKAAEADRAARFTVRVLGEEFIKEHFEKALGGRYGKETGSVFRRDVIGAWGDRPVAEIRRSDVRKLLAEIEENGGPIAANRRQAAISKFFNWALASYDEDETDLGSNPAARLPLRGKETPRDRLLSGAELRVIWKAAERVGGPYGAVVRLLMLTGQRRGECGGIAWPEINETKAEWLMPGSRTKNGRDHLVPLSADALTLIKASRALVAERAKKLEIEAGPFVFSTDAGRSAIGGYSKYRIALDEKVAEVVAEERAGGNTELSVEEFRLHDIRRAVATGLASLGIDRETVRAILNHSDGSVTGRHYDLYERVDEKRRALDRWAKHLAGIVAGKSAGNVVPIRKGGRRRG